MSKFARHCIGITAAVALFATSAGAQLLPSVSLPPISVPMPVPVTNVPVVGPVIEDVLRQPQAQQVIRPTLHSVSGLPRSIAEAGAPTLLELRRLRLQELIRENRALLEADDRGQPVRRGTVIVVDPDPLSLQLATLLELRRLRLQELIRENRALLEADDRGQLVRRGTVIAVDPDPLSLQLATLAGFRILADQSDPSLGMRVVQLAVPRGMGARAGLKLVQQVAPRIQADFDHIFEPAGGALMPMKAALASSARTGGGPAIGMIDGGAASHPSMAGARIEQNGFAGSPQPTGHGTAVASLLVGNQGPFRGAATGAQLYVADVYGGNRAAGSASVIVKALGWLASHRPKVINISLVGPPNKAVARAIQIIQSRGIHVVAAVGNDGPAAPPQYPASYAGVVAVTAVDARGRALPEAGKPRHLDFAAPGADMAAALPGKGYARVRGTSFAAPLAAARLLIAGSRERLAAEARPGKGRVGRGIVCGDCRTDPRKVRAR